MPDDSSGEGGNCRGQTGPHTMIFVARGDQSPAFNAHFPRMVGAASKNNPSDDKIRLVGFSKACSDRLSTCLGVARVSSIAVRHGAPGADALLRAVKGAVKPVDIGWLEGERDPSYLTTKINSIETTVGTKRVKQG